MEELDKRISEILGKLDADEKAALESAIDDTKEFKTLIKRAVKNAGEERFKVLTDSLPQSVFEIDLEGNFTYVNKQGFKSTGYTQDDVDNGLSAFQLFVPGDRDRVKANIANVLGGKLLNGTEYTALRKDGSMFPVLVYSAPIFENSVPVGLRGVVVDITVRKQMEEALRQAKKMEAVGYLAGGIAHEFNNMLTSIMGNAELARASHPDDKKLVGQMGYIISSGEKARDLTRQLLGFAKKGAYSPQDMDINIVVKEVSKWLEEKFASATHYRSKHKTDSKKQIYADGTQMHQILRDLAAHAEESMPHGGTITLSTEDVTVEEEIIGRYALIPAGNYVRISVSDTSPGISEERLKNLFEPFSAGTESWLKGTALRLAAAYGIVQRHGAYMDVKPEQSKGTTFEIYFPADKK